VNAQAGTSGIPQQLGSGSPAPLEVGQKVTAGSILAKIAQPEHLKADLKISETELKDITLGQRAENDTRNGVVQGRVIRIDPASVNGTVAVDVAMAGALPQGARPRDMPALRTARFTCSMARLCGKPVRPRRTGSILQKAL
jgi:HlyD family secretion protein